MSFTFNITPIGGDATSIGTGSRRGSRRGSSRVASRKSSIDPTKLIRMDRASFTPGDERFNVLFIGAGNIMFGSPEGPWNHSFRLEHKLGPRLNVVAIVDPAVERAAATVQAKCESFVRSAYENTRICKNLDEFVNTMTKKELPKAVVIGSPPMFRGSTLQGRDIEIQILKKFPGIALFVEKPVATGRFEELKDAFDVAKVIDDSGSICSVGYMLRYLKAVQMMKKTIEINKLTVMATIARYACAYEAIAKPDWWDKSKSAGPIIEQGTHFCDLSRYFGGEVDISTVAAHSLEWYEGAGKLSGLVIDEEKIEPENRIPRITSATWKYESGAVGTFTHCVALKGHDYSCELEVFADGYQMKLVNPYVQPVLHIRRPGNDIEETYRFPDDDPFFSEISVFIDNIEDIEEDPETATMLSSYEDACKTYELTWAIRLASERSRKSYQPPAPA